MQPSLDGCLESLQAEAGSERVVGQLEEANRRYQELCGELEGRMRRLGELAPQDPEIQVSGILFFSQSLNRENNTYRDGILGHKFEKRLGSFAPCYSQSFLLADFKENHTLLCF